MTEPTLLSLIRQVRAQRRSQRASGCASTRRF